MTVVVAEGDLQFDRLRLELSLDNGVGVWERALAGPGTIRLEPGGVWTGQLVAWGLRGTDSAPEVVAYGKTRGAAGAARAEVLLRPASDPDGDWIPTEPPESDNCPRVPNPLQRDDDGDGVGNVCDVCPTVEDPEQRDEDNDGVGDACTPPLCGNGRLEPPEGCDDGNVTAGDGCSPDCRVERCGNGEIEPGEACDDGNSTSGDGCAADCWHEPVRFEVIEPIVGVPQPLEPMPGRLWVLLVTGQDWADLHLHEVDPASGRPGDHVFSVATRRHWPVPLGLAAGGTGAFGLLWLELAEGGTQVPARLWAVSVGFDGTPLDVPRTVAEFGSHQVAGWGTWSGEPAAMVFESGFEPRFGQWVDVGHWPPSPGERATRDRFLGAFSAAGAWRPQGGWIAAWLGTSEAIPWVGLGLWVRRFDADRQAVDAAEFRWEVPMEASAVWVLHEASADAYLVGVRGGPDTYWYRLGPVGNQVHGPLRGYALPRHAEVVAVGDGTLLAAWAQAEETGCMLEFRRLDSAGALLGGGLRVLADAGTEPSDCRADVLPLSDGRLLVTWVCEYGRRSPPRYTLGWWLVGSAAHLLT